MKTKLLGAVPKTKQTLSRVLLTALFISLTYVAHGNSATVEGTTECNSTTCKLINAKIKGQIDDSTVETVRSLIEQAKDRARREKKKTDFSGVGDEVSLDSNGGSVTAAMAIGRLFRNNDVSVGVTGNCYSACVFILAGAVGRGYVGKVGIHRPYFDTSPDDVSSGEVKERYAKMLAEMRAYFREMNVSQDLVDVMLQIEPHKVHLLFDGIENYIDLSKAYRTLERYGLTSWDPVFEEIRDLRVAKSYNLDRREYLRRTAIADSACRDFDTYSECWDTIMRTGKRGTPTADKIAIQRECSVQATARGLHGDERRESRAECKNKLGLPAR
jgi:hypothetical protein